MVWWDTDDLARRMEEGNRSSMEMAQEADDAITRLLASDQHDAATKALRQVVEVARGGGDVLAVLETLARSGAVSRWQALHDILVDLAEMLHAELPGHSRGDGSLRAELSGEGFFYGVEGGYLSRYRRVEDVTDDGPRPVPSEVASYLRDCSGEVLGWLTDLQRSCGQQAPLIKHDRFVRLCHEACGGKPPQHALALAPSATSAEETIDAPGDHDSCTAAADKQAPMARRWSQMLKRSATGLLTRRPRLSFIVTLAVVVLAAVWSSWHILSDANRVLSGFVAGMVAVALIRPLLTNLWWVLTVLVGPPIRVAAWLVDTFETSWSPWSPGRRPRPVTRTAPRS